MRLSDCAQGRDNNFNLIRIIAALAVLVGHSFALTIKNEPVIERLGLSLGGSAVDLFFVTSGFLVTASLLRRQHLGEFVWARGLRIFPALWLVLFLSAFVLGPIFTNLPLSRYFTTPQTFIYPGRCGTLFTGVSYTLPGVFENNPFARSVNGSLWTLPDEVRVYAILALSWLLLQKKPGATSSRFQTAIGGLVTLSICGMFAASAYLPSLELLFRHFYMFFAGGFYFIHRDRIHLSHALFWLLAIALLTSTLKPGIFAVVYALSFPYLLLFLAYVPGGLIRGYNQLGDYSYGVYIYAFPVQQMTVARYPGITPGKMIAVAASITVILAVLSWHLLEKPMLKLKQHFVDHSTQVLAYGRQVMSNRRWRVGRSHH